MKEFIYLFVTILVTILVILFAYILCFAIIYDMHIKCAKDKPRPQKRKKHSRKDDTITLEQCKELYYPEYRFIVARRRDDVPLYAFATFEDAKDEIKRLMMTCCDSYYIVNLDKQ